MDVARGGRRESPSKINIPRVNDFKQVVLSHIQEHRQVVLRAPTKINYILSPPNKLHVMLPILPNFPTIITVNVSSQLQAINLLRNHWTTGFLGRHLAFRCSYTSIKNDCVIPFPTHISLIALFIHPPLRFNGYSAHIWRLESSDQILLVSCGFCGGQTPCA